MHNFIKYLKIQWKAPRLSIAAISLLLCSAPGIQANTPEQKGLEIAIEADKVDSGWKDSTVSLNMILRNEHGDESERSLMIYTLEGSDDGDKSVILFNLPSDLKSTAMLTYSHKFTSDDQWLYLPALKRVKRIASNNKSGPFMGSEFAYEDLASQEVEKYKYKYVRNEALNSKDHYVIERYPVYEGSGYTKQVVWMDIEFYRISRIEFFDGKKQHIKTLLLSDYKEYAGKYWRSVNLKMKNEINGKETMLKFDDYQLFQGLHNDMFSQNGFKSVR